MFSEVFIVAEVYGVGDKESGDYHSGSCTCTLGGLLEMCLFH